jgi:transposase, IS5 family
LVAWLKENPGKATAGTVGVGGPEVTGIYYQKKTGTSFQFVPYRGGAPLNQDMLAGHIDYGHTLGTVIPQMQALIGNILHRCITDAGYRGHNAPPDHKFKVYTSGQKRRVTPQIKREFKRRAAIEPVIGHLKEHHRMGRNHLAHASGDAINAVLAAAGYNFRRLLAWLRLLLLRILIAFSLPTQLKSV